MVAEGRGIPFESGADGLPQAILPGAAPSARQAAAARDQQGRGMMVAKVPQQPAGGLFAFEGNQEEMF